MNPSSSSGRCDSQSPEDDHMDGWLYLSSDSVDPRGLEVGRDGQESEDRGKLKSKLVSAWNSVKYGQFHLSNILTALNCRCVVVDEDHLFCFSSVLLK